MLNHLTWPCVENLAPFLPHGHAREHQNRTERYSNLPPLKFASQLGEDAIIFKRFFSGPRLDCRQDDSGRCGHTYLELGANDGVRMSNSLFFRQLGWRGVLVEAVPKYCSLLKQKRCSDVVVCGAVCSRSFGTELEIVEHSGTTAAIGMGATDEFVRKWNKGPAEIRANTRKVPCAPLSDMLLRAQLPSVTLFSLDVEGQENQVLRTLDWKTFSFGVLIIELPCAPNPRNATEAAAARSLLRTEGYAFLAYQGGMNEVWYNPRLQWASTSAERVRRTLPAKQGPLSSECPHVDTHRNGHTSPAKSRPPVDRARHGGGARSHP
jgi:FkbM family methyltransferase